MDHVCGLVFQRINSSCEIILVLVLTRGYFLAWTWRCLPSSKGWSACVKMVVGSNPNHNTVLKEVVLSRENDQVSVLKSVKSYVLAWNWSFLQSETGLARSVLCWFAVLRRVMFLCEIDIVWNTKKRVKLLLHINNCWISDKSYALNVWKGNFFGITILFRYS